MSEMATAVAGTAADLGFGIGIEPEPAEPAAEPTEAAETETPSDPLIDLAPELPEDLASFLDEPDEETLDVEAAAVAEQYTDDPEEIARELAKTRKALAYEKDQRVKVARKGWEAEGEKFFPLADLTGIQADSRRAFLRLAKAQHERALAVIRPRLEEADRIRQQAREQALAEERERVAGAYGRPTVGGPSAAAPTTAEDRLQMARQRRDLSAGVRALLDAGAV